MVTVLRACFAQGHALLNGSADFIFDSVDLFGRIEDGRFVRLWDDDDAVRITA